MKFFGICYLFLCRPDLTPSHLEYPLRSRRCLANSASRKICAIQLSNYTVIINFLLFLKKKFSYCLSLKARSKTHQNLPPSLSFLLFMVKFYATTGKIKVWHISGSVQNMTFFFFKNDWYKMKKASAEKRLWLDFNHVHPISFASFSWLVSRPWAFWHCSFNTYCKYPTTLITIKLKNWEVGASYFDSTVLR